MRILPLCMLMTVTSCHLPMGCQVHGKYNTLACFLALSHCRFSGRKRRTSWQQEGASADARLTLRPAAQAALGLRRQANGVSRCRERGERADEEPPRRALMARGGFEHRNRCQNHPKGMRIMPETSAPCAPNPYEGLATRRGAGGLQGGLPNLISSPHPFYLVILDGRATTVWLAIKLVCPAVWCIRAVIPHSPTYPNRA